MLIEAINQLQVNPLLAIVAFVTFAFSLVVAISFHEFSHALVATRLGDLTAKRLGRLSLHPMRHLDPIGTLMILMAGFGWGKPVPVVPGNLNTGERAGMAAVSLAGPLSNILLAAVAAIPVRTGLVSYSFGAFPGLSGAGGVTEYVISSLIFWNLLLAAFNLLPIAPLDGFKVALGVLPRNLARSFARLEPYGPMILLGLIMLSFISPRFSVLPLIIGPVIRFLGSVVVG